MPEMRWRTVPPDDGIQAPLLVLWSSRDDLEELHGDPRQIWRGWATHVSGRRIDSGHHMAEEAPSEVAAVLAEFFGIRG